MYPNAYRDELGLCDESSAFKKYFNYLERVLSANSTGSLAGVIVEPYQGAGGSIFPPRGWLKKLLEWAKVNGLLITLDEVQSSYGRTGKMWAMEHENIQPDIVVLGKGIGSGAAVSAVCATTEVFSCLRKGEMSSTYGGNPIANAGRSTSGNHKTASRRESRRNGKSARKSVVVGCAQELEKKESYGN